MRCRQIFFIVFVLIDTAYCQKETKEAQKVFTKAYGVSTATNTSIIGGAMVRITRPAKPFKGRVASNYYVLEGVNIKSLREYASTTNASERIIYGKLNYLWTIRPQVGKEITVFEKLDSEGIGFNFIVAGGPSFGVQKPYYIKYDTGKQRSDRIIYVPFNPALHFDETRILGNGGVFKGIFDSKIIAGAHLKTAFNFDISAFKENATGIELGILAEVYAKQPELVAYNKSPQFFVSPFVSLYFGKKRTK
jgi:hypothetical protein